MPASRVVRARRRCRIVLGAAALAACQGDGATGVGAAPVRLALSARVVDGAARTVAIRATYRRVTGEDVAVVAAPERVALAVGASQAVPVAIEIAPCMRDTLRLGGAGGRGCPLTVRLQLLDGEGGEIDAQAVTPETPPAPGETVSLPAVTLGTRIGAVAVAPGTLSLTLGGAAATLTATVQDTRGAALADRPVSWAVSDTAVAQLSAASGPTTAVTARRAGTAAITAASGGKSYQLAVTVLPPEPLGVSPATASVQVGRAVTLAVAAAPGPVEWASADPAVASVDANGVVTARAPGGPVTVTARSGARSGSARVTVTALPPLEVAPRDAVVEAGDTLRLALRGADGAPAAWSSANGEVASVDDAGLVTGRAAGTTTVTAAAGGRSAAATVTVTTAPTIDVAQEPGPGCVIVGQTVRLAARGAPAAVTWSSADERVATVDAAGAVTGRARGAATVRAASANRVGTVGVCVTGPLSVAPATLTLVAGQGAQLAAADADGGTLAWESDAPAVATVDGAGRVVAVGVGRATVAATLTAASGSARAAAAVTVNAASLAVSLGAPRAVVGQGVTATARALDANGGELRGVAVAWTVDDPAVAQLSAATGASVTVRALRPGATAVRASGGGATGQAGLAVVAGEPTTVVVAVGGAALPFGQAAAASAEVRDAAGAVLGGQTVTWSVSPAGAAVVTPTGPLTATLRAADPRGGRVELRAAAGGAGGSVPVALLAAFDSARAVSAGAGFSCLTTYHQGTVCWGENRRGQLGDGTTTSSTTARPVVNASGTLRGFEPLAAGPAASHGCGTGPQGTACWGENGAGQLGDRTTATRATSAPLAVPLRFVRLATGQSHSCGVTDAGALYCWGLNEFGQLGDGTRTSRTVPGRVALDATVSFVAVGQEHSCAVTSRGAPYCWGRNDGGQVGDGTLETRLVPTAVLKLALRVAPGTITAGAAHACAIGTDGVTYCWGRNADGQLGDGSTADRRAPVAVAGGLRLVSVSAGGRHSCGLAADDARQTGARAYCWGFNGFGGLGDGSTASQPRPVPAAGELRFSLDDPLAAGTDHTCGITTLAGGVPFCWGRNDTGQLGDGTRASRATPAAVFRP